MFAPHGCGSMAAVSFWCCSGVIPLGSVVTARTPPLDSGIFARVGQWDPPSPLHTGVQRPYVPRGAGAVQAVGTRKQRAGSCSSRQDRVKGVALDFLELFNGGACSETAALSLFHSAAYLLAVLASSVPSTLLV